MSKFKIFFIIVCCLCIFVVSPGFTYAQAEKGDKEILINGYLFAQTGEFGFASITTFFNYGVFFTDSLQVGGGPSITYTQMAAIEGFEDSGGGELSINLNAFVRKYFLKEGSKTVFYAGGEGFYYDAFREGSLLYLRPFVGLKYYFMQKVAFDANLGYGFGLKKDGGGMFSGTFGVSIIL
jgi:hypothetical protein